MRNKISGYKKYFLVLFIMFVLAWYISTYQYQLMLIQGDSMAPSFHNLQLVVLEKNYDGIVAGDVIACRAEALDAVLVKRVVAGPGDTIQIADGILYVNGNPSECQRPEIMIEYAGIAEEPIVLGLEEYFLLGDNYEYSKDSRYEEINVIAKNDIIGVIL